MINIQGVNYRYRNAADNALESISLEVQPGKILGLLGPNGAGKTTLISLLSGNLKLQSGSILVDGTDLQNLHKNNPAAVCLAPQDFAFYPSLTVGENLTFFARISPKGEGRRTAEAQIEFALDFCQLSHVLKQPACSLSGGLQRRLNLAITLLASPNYLLLDEPTVGVDPQTRAFILESVKALSQSGLGVVYTSHYMEEVEAIADQLAIIDGGKLLRYGDKSALLESRSSLCLKLVNLSEEESRAKLAEFGNVEVAPADDCVSLEIDLLTTVTVGQVLAAVEGAGGRICEVSYGRPKLESLFLGLTHRSLRD
ncbi:ABC transporter ATP-binding protein [Simiduia aestuariiviva]|uniref:ABC-2 type transport system ATP-binding protein n=1 Tax=Simiduia aestuariiviva TaxID=1510459 RepID=A0A839UR48_9GAMM|nr:ABC transporter ATP-binding protein [Simiduia aestuariiviva]MBB3168336.1 ABC-2 type transport system ATP-binding protein [Simiduia aestuariiviva]